jgi:hypothetical protein
MKKFGFKKLIGLGIAAILLISLGMLTLLAEKKISYESCMDMAPTPDGGFILVGGTKLPTGYPCAGYVVKTYANGNKEWERTYGGKKADNAQKVIQTLDGGYAIAGSRIY